MGSTYSLTLLRDARKVEMYLPLIANPNAASWDFIMPDVPPKANESLVFDGTKFSWFTPGTSNAAGTVTSVTLVVPTSIFDLALGSNQGTVPEFTISLKSQTQSQFFAAPSTANGNPLFRTIGVSDLPTIPEGKIATLPWSKITNGGVGGEIIPVSKMGSATNSVSFTIDDDATDSVRLQNNGGTLEVRNKGNTDFASIRVGRLFQQSAEAVELQTETLSVADNEIELNSNATDATESAGITVNRGNVQSDAKLTFNEGTDKWQAGIGTQVYNLIREIRGTFTSSSNTTLAVFDATAGAQKLTINHNLDSNIPSVTVSDSGGNEIWFTPKVITVNQIELDFSKVGTPTGTWRYSVQA